MNPNERLDCSDMENTRCPKCFSEKVSIIKKTTSDDYGDVITEYLVCSACNYAECLGSDYK
jgi:C4-type Zn-finger protein